LAPPTSDAGSTTGAGGPDRGPARRPRAGHGCLALAALPLLAIVAPITAHRRRAASRRRGSDIVVGWRRRRDDGLLSVAFEIDVPAPRWAEVTDALAGAIAEAAAATGATLGCVGIVDGEEPILIALAPRRDVVGEHATVVLASRPPHRHAQLWLTLPPGAYLAGLIDPYVPFRLRRDWLAGVLGSGAAGSAVAFEVAEVGVSTRVAVEVYAAPPDLRRFLSLARSSLATLPGWRASR